MSHPALIYMQQAIDIAPRSPHSTNKIAAVLFGQTAQGKDFSIGCTNHWPEPIYEKIGTAGKIGNSSGTIHAETAAIVSTRHAIDGASICITDPFCPNCAKNMAEAGIKNIYIDQNGFDKDFFKRRGGDFDKMSMRICERAGINVYAVNIDTEDITPILEIADDYIPVEDSPIITEPLERVHDGVFLDLIEQATAINQRRKFTLAFVEDAKGRKFSLVVRAHAVVGYTMQHPDEALDLLTPIGKYSFIQEPVNRMIMHIGRRGYKICDEYFYCSQVPTAREQVNLVGANVKRITIGDAQKCRDPEGLKAMMLLKDHHILDYS